MTKIRLPPHVAEVMPHFSGRTWLLPKIQDWHKNSKKRILLITGMPGTGKSMFAAWLAGYGRPPRGKEAAAALRILRQQVTGAFFCRADTYENSPMECGNHLARQAAQKLPRDFAQALANQGGKRVQIVFKKVEVGAKATGIVLKRLDLGGLLDEPAFDLALLKPLRELEDAGKSIPALFLVDALDEGSYYTGQFKVHQAVKKLSELNDKTRVIATLRSKSDELQYFPNAERVDLIEDAPVDNGVSVDIRDYLEARLAGRGNGGTEELKDHLLQASGGYFLFAHLVLQDWISRMEKGEQLALADVPEALNDYYHRFLLRLRDQQNRSWENELRPVLGVLAVAQGEGLSRTAISKFTRRDLVTTLDTLQSFKQYLIGRFDQGPFRLFHQSFADFLLDDQNGSGRLVEAFDPHARIVDYYWPSALEAPDRENWDEYGESFMPVHLAGASQIPDGEETHRLAKRMVQLVVDPVFEKAKNRPASDPTWQESALSLALQTACADPLANSLPLVIKSARAYLHFRKELLQPEMMLEDAQAGRIDQALRKLPAFLLDSRWEKAVRLVLAWIALEKNEVGARQAFAAVAVHHPFPMPLPVLHARVNQALGGPPAELVPLPPVPSREDAEERIHRLSAYKTKDVIEGYHGEPGYDGYLAESIDIHIGNIPAYITQNDAPFLVAYARTDPEAGTEAFRAYSRLHAVNQYREYRSIQFWLLLDAILRHPETDWVLPRLRELVNNVLSGRETAFEEGSQLVLLALQASAGHPGALQSLEERSAEAVALAKDLEEQVRGRGDVWGEHKRRFCALALAHAALAGLPDGGSQEGSQVFWQLLETAGKLPRGYAGLMVPAWLNLAETALVCSADSSHPLVLAARQQALETVHKINDPLFCARATAQVNAMNARWWPFPSGMDLEETVLDFARDPGQARFSPVHLVKTEYKYRDQEEASAFPMDAFVAEARLPGIAEMFRIEPETLYSLNPALPRGPGEELKEGTEVNLPDPKFTPLLAARFAAELAASDLSARKKRLLIQALVPAALADLTCLDAVLARLLFVSRPSTAVLDELADLPTVD